MSSSHYSTVFHKKNSTPGVIPALSSLSAAEIAVNTHDGILFTKADNDSIKTFLNKDLLPYKLDTSLSAVTPQYGQNIASQVLSNILGGYSNNVSGAGSSVINGELNGVAGDFAFVGGGAQNTILSAGDFSAILGGHHNLISHTNSFTLGSNLTSHADNFTYANNISAGTIFGSGIEISNAGIKFLDSTTQTTAFTGMPAGVQSTYTTVCANSANWNNGYATANIYQSVSSTYVSLTSTQTLTNKIIVDWMTLVRGYNTTPTLCATITTGDVYTYTYDSSPSNITYYRYIATNGSEDSFYTYFFGASLSGLVASKSITL